MNPPETSHGSLAQYRKRIDGRVPPLLRRSAKFGFLGGMPVADQIDHALGFVWSVETELQRHPYSVIDLGSGGGIPGIVLLSCWPGARLVLLDANERRTEFLEEETMAWGDSPLVEVVRGRAEEIGRDEGFREQFEVVTARSFGPPAVTAECGSPLLALGGMMVVSEPPDSADQIRWPADGVSQVGMTCGEHLRFGDRYGYQVLHKSEATPERYPRRVGIPAKRPLF